jgi:hypothetical protein
MEEVLITPERDEAATQEAALALLGRRPRPSAPLATGEFTLRNLEAGRWRVAAQLPDENWYLRAINADSKAPVTAAARKSSTPTTPLNPARNGLILKSGEKLTGVTLTITEGAAALKGKVTSESGKPTGKTRVHLLPAEKEAADDVVRYAEVRATGDGNFHFKNLAPGRYYLLGKPIKDHAAARPLGWDNAQRATLRREAEAAGNTIELKSCQHINDYKLNLK